MNVSRFSVVDEIMETPLLTLADVFKKTEARELTRCNDEGYETHTARKYGDSTKTAARAKKEEHMLGSFKNV